MTTRRTKDDLLNNLFQDGQAPKSITAGDVRDLTESTYNNFGFMDYSNGTPSPISLLAGVDTTLTNNGAGGQTLGTYKPIGVTELWNTTTNRIDLSELELGDQIMVRVDITFESLTANTDLDLGMKLGAGLGEYTLRFLTGKSHKAAQVYPNETIEISFYIGDDNTRNNPVEIFANAEKNAQITVNGWYIRVN